MIQNKKGFTLIELIIVMAIIGILAVVAVIAIGSKSADARDARRLSDMSTIRTAMALHCAQPVNAAGTTQSTTVLADAGATTLIRVGLVPNAATSTTYINFSTIADPSASTTACAVGATAQCDYAFGTAAAGAAFVATTDDIDACDYWINFYQEGADDDGYVTEDGIVE